MSMWNTTKVARAGRAYLAGFALVILSASLAEATFGPRTTIGANYQQSSNTTSTDASAEGPCNGTNFCFVLFQRAPQQKALIVQHLSCRVSVSAGSLQYGSVRSRKGPDLPFRNTYFTPVTTTGAFWIVNSPVMHLVESKGNPVVFFSNSTNALWSPTCTISGRLLQP